MIENALFFNGFCNSYFDDVRYDGGGILAVPDMTEVGYVMLQNNWFCNVFFVNLCKIYCFCNVFWT